MMGVLSGPWFFSYANQCFTNMAYGIPFVGTLYYESTDCSGTPYVTSFYGQIQSGAQGVPNPVVNIAGLCFRANPGGGTRTFRIKLPATRAQHLFRSYNSGNFFTAMTCTTYAGSTEFGFEVAAVSGDPFVEFPPNASWTLSF